LCRFLETLPADAGILFLVSGGASSLVEVLPGSTGLEQLQQLNHWLIASGLDITAINRVRRCVSRIKGGGLVKYLHGRKTTVLLISDVAGDDPAIIGSGLLYRGETPGVADLDLPGWVLNMTEAGSHIAASDSDNHGHIAHHVVASLDLALQAAARKGREIGYSTGIMDGPLVGEAADAGARLLEQLRDSQAGLYLWGGETTVTLPANPVVLLSAGTDGTDGSTLAAGAIVDPATITRGAAAGLECGQCLKKADSGSYLEACGDVFVTGPTGTNVTDMVIAIKLDISL
jgi:hydroxypyruvate reductase